MGQPAVGDGDLGGGHAPGLGGRGDQHRPGGGAGLAVAVPGRGDRGRAAGPLGDAAPGEVAVELGVAAAADDVDLVPAGAELLDDQRGEAVVGALAHVELRRDHRDPVVGGDADVGLERVDGSGAAALSCARPGAARKPTAKPPATAAAPSRKPRRLARTAAGAAGSSSGSGTWLRPPAGGRLRGSRRGCAGRWRSGRGCPTSPRRCPRRSASASRPAAPRPT